jgi:hypothetical protein
MSIYFKNSKDGILVGNQYFEVLHSRKDGGAWKSLIFKNGSGKNLIAKPMSSHFSFSNPGSPTVMYNENYAYHEALDKKAALSVGRSKNGDVVVTATGRYTRDNGQTLPARFVRTTTYNEFGLVKTFLDVTAEEPIDKVVEFSAMEINLREGLNKAFVKHHPMLMQALEFQGAGWLDLPRQGYTARYMPSYVALVEQNVEGIELFPGSDYHEWDTFAGAEIKGICFIAGGGKTQTMVALNPHCMAFKRIGIKVEGTHRFEVNFGIPFVKDKREVFFKTFQCGTDSNWPKDSQIKELAENGMQLFRYHNDYRENGPFWHDGTYPPYDKKGMKELKRVIETSHKHGMKIIPYISLKEFHPESPGYLENYKDWQRMEVRSGEVSHNYFFTGEFGALMCMKSGWLERRKQDVETMLKDLPWDGLYFDWCTYHSCCNEKHAPGWHTDVNEFLDFVMWCRKRIGKKGFLFVHLSLVPSLICENMADLVCVGESSNFADPESWDPEYYFVPITQKLSAKWGMTGQSANFAAMSGMLEGFPLGTALPMNKTMATIFREYRLFAGVDLASYKLVKASEKPVATGEDGVWANLYYGKGCALIYAANLTAEKKDAKLSVDLGAYGIKGRLSVEAVRNEPPAPDAAQKSKAASREADKIGKKLSAKQRAGNVAPEPEDKFLLWQDEKIDNGKVVRERFASDAEAFMEGVGCELSAFSSVLLKITVK